VILRTRGGRERMGAETILLIVILTFAAGYVPHRWDARRDRSGADTSRKRTGQTLELNGLATCLTLRLRWSVGHDAPLPVASWPSPGPSLPAAGRGAPFTRFKLEAVWTWRQACGSSAIREHIEIILAPLTRRTAR
jgi:hypothetical protein